MLLEYLADLDAWWDKREPLEVNGSDKARKYSKEKLEVPQYDFDLYGFTQEDEKILPPTELITHYKAECTRHEKIMDEALGKIFALIGEARA